MSESDVVNTNNNSTDEIATKDPKNESLKRKENEVRLDAAADDEIETCSVLSCVDGRWW